MKHNRNKDWEARQWLRDFLNEGEKSVLDLEVVDFEPEQVHTRGYDPRNNRGRKAA